MSTDTPPRSFDPDDSGIGATYKGTPEMHQLVLGQAFTCLAAFR